MNEIDFTALCSNIKAWALDLGFAQMGITDCDIGDADERLQAWLAKGYHGAMHYMGNNRELRKNPEKLHPGTLRIISVRMDYLIENHNTLQILENRNKAAISRYALGRDYHKVMRKKLNILAKKINDIVPHGYRAFTDSAPVFERKIAEKAGIGWIGKNTMIMNKQAGSFFFLGELFTNLPLPLDKPVEAHCGSCTACIDICPTKAIVAPYQIDARRCISYLTIEHKGSIDPKLRPLMGNRIYGCDDCQLFCPWNKFAKFTPEKDFQPRHNLKDVDLIELFSWSEKEFLEKTEGSAIRRAGYISWLRNIAIALGNAEKSEAVISALKSRENHDSNIVREHVAWALSVV
ncbi:MAG: tRNA epoxyqueuosine(34) reductase QueG [Gammaproteobacteria bacterium RIFCSPHIGHO2_12_FULL_38_11]|nr:MAG: tRNA epoxyqueuosine(34) reductase QueG [Gammaproteobacteria bacterium RIFCSPHIGHO2_12_FULL_38_11]